MLIPTPVSLQAEASSGGVGGWVSVHPILLLFERAHLSSSQGQQGICCWRGPFAGHQGQRRSHQGLGKEVTRHTSDGSQSSSLSAQDSTPLKFILAVSSKFYFMLGTEVVDQMHRKEASRWGHTFSGSVLRGSKILAKSLTVPTLGARSTDTSLPCPCSLSPYSTGQGLRSHQNVLE